MKAQPKKNKSEGLDIYLNVFPLFNKPQYEQDASYSEYLETCLNYLAPDVIHPPGTDSRYIATLRSFKAVKSAWDAFDVSWQEGCKQTRAALVNLQQGAFFVLHFPTHSCDVVVFPDSGSSEHVLFVPMELRRTEFSTGYRVKEKGMRRACYIALPRVVLRVAKKLITARWLHYAADLQRNQFAGAYPLGTGRAVSLPDSRKSPTPTYILEWLLPLLLPTSLPVPESLKCVKTIAAQRRFSVQGVPWRRSVHWTSLRFTAALVQRWYDYPLAHYKILQLGFKAWLAVKYHSTNDMTEACQISKREEIMQCLALRSRKLLALNGGLGAVVTAVSSTCQPIQQCIDRFHITRMDHNAAASTLPPSIDLTNISDRFALPAEVMQILRDGVKADISALKEDVSAVMSPVEFINGFLADPLGAIAAVVRELLNAASHIAKQKPDLASFTTHWILHGTELFIFHCFGLMSALPFKDDEIDSWATQLAALSEAYSALIPKNQSAASPERKSREVLASWCLVALIDCVACKKWRDLFRHMGMCLPIELIQGLTFREQSVMVTAAQLIKYRRSLAKGSGLFDTSDPAATQHFVTVYFNSAAGADMAAALAKERADEMLREEQLHDALEAAKHSHSQLQSRPCTCDKDKEGERVKCNRCKKIKELNAVNTRVVHPLPTDEQQAKEIIFFSALPAVLGHYGTIVAAACSLHRRVTFARHVSADCCKWSREHGLKLASPSTSVVSLGSSCKPLETDSHFKELSKFVANIIHPQFSTLVTIRGVDLASLKPVDVGYQYQLTGSLKALPWMADAVHTENAVLAAQSSMPATMTKHEFITFGRVRAAPNLQLRELIMALASLSVNQLGNGDFLTLTQRVLYELGPTEDATESCPWTWKRDLTDGHWLADLHRCLTDIFAKIRQNWESHSVMRLIIEVSTFVVRFSGDARFSDLLLHVQTVLLAWITEVDELIEEFITDLQLVSKWRLLLMQFYSYLLLSALTFTKESLIYRSRLATLQQICYSSATVGIRDLLRLVDAHTFNNASHIHDIVTRDPSIFTALLVAVDILDEPQPAPWKRVQQNNRTLDWYTSGALSVNPISGQILRDGLTVSELPSVIVQTPIYQEVMQNANFIVQRVNGEYITRLHGTRRFSFGLWQHNSEQYPLINELREDGAQFTLLPRNFIASAGLPVSLIEHTAHWVDFARRVIEFRPIALHSTVAITYVMRVDESLAAGAVYVQGSTPGRLLNATDMRLDKLRRVLTRIDTFKHIMCVRSVQHKVVYLRYNLSFTLHGDGTMMSDDFPGYRLASTQSVPTVPLFTGYLHIQPTSPHSTKLPLLLIPCKDLGQVYPYEFDATLRRLIPATTAARILLAHIYAAHSLAVDPLTHTSGYQQALALLQQCWQSSPYSAEELSLLTACLELEEVSPAVRAIKLLVCYLVRVSQRLSFMHPDSTALQLNAAQVVAWKKGYRKAKLCLPFGCTLDEAVDAALYASTSTAPVIEPFVGRLYFGRVAKIFFAPETLPKSLKLNEFFENQTKVAAVTGQDPTSWVKSASQPLGALFFSFMKNIAAKENLFAHLTFMAHQTLIKNERGLELLQCLYSTMVDATYPRPDSQLMNSSMWYTTTDLVVTKELIRFPSQASSQEIERAWTIYSEHYLDAKGWAITKLNHDEQHFASFNQQWRSALVRSLTHWNDSRYLSRLFWEYRYALVNAKMTAGPPVVLAEDTTVPRLQSLNYAWSSRLKANLELSLGALNKFSNGLETFDAELAKCCAADAQPLSELPLVEFPLKNHVIEGSEELQSRVVRELRDSFRQFSHSRQRLPAMNTDQTRYETLKAHIDGQRDQIWTAMETLLTNCGDDPLLKLWQGTNMLQRPHPRIVPALLLGTPHVHATVNPCLKDSQLLHELALHYAVLQVHSIKLARVIELLADLRASPESDHEGLKAQVHAELSDRREWSARDRPQWLVFEMERRLCLRAVQVEIASEMLHEQNIVLQLNMGEGKSKVIVPILCSVLADGKTLVRVNVLAPLLHEVHNYLKLALGNMLGRRIYLFPFRRNIALDSESMGLLRDSIDECKRSGGVILATPEHRLSSELKYREVLWQSTHTTGLKPALTASDFKGVIDVPTLELLDESDEILRHKYQLIYTLGEQQAIEGGSHRWAVHLALIRCIFMTNLWRENSAAVPSEYCDQQRGGAARLERLHTTLHTSTAHCIFQASATESHVLPVVRLIGENFFDELRTDLFDVFQLDPVWRAIEKGRSVQEIAQLKDFILNNFTDTPDGNKECEQMMDRIMLDKPLKVPVLTLRGLLSFDVLKIALTKRHRIHYGIDRSRAVAMAVPFRGKDTPAEGVEFGQPDLAITLTVLAHGTGIDSDAVKKCFTFLKTKGTNEQRKIYKVWYDMSRPIMSSQLVTLLEHVEAVNVENVNLMQHLARYYGRNYEVIAYYLDNFVLPVGTRSFPQKIVANAWDLARSSHKVVGFSGTDDTKHMLPLYVTQRALAAVASTNGKMVDVLTNVQFHNQQYQSLPKELESERILREMCAHDSWSVLIDSGALIEGMSNQEVVAKVLDFSPRFQTGICFDEFNRLVLMDRHGNVALLNSNRPLDCTCFTYLDDIHTRGTDLPFPSQEEAIIPYASQGFHHIAATTGLKLLQDNPFVKPSEVIKAAVSNELLATEEMYGIPLNSINVKDHIAQHGTAIRHALLGHDINPSYNLTEAARPLYEQLIRHATSLAPTGQVLRMSTTSVHDECERELQQEVEEERQRELPAAVKPADEQTWPFEQITTPDFWTNALASEPVDRVPLVLPLRDLFLNTALDAEWRENRAFDREDAINNIYLTPNFVFTVVADELSNYLRPIDVVIKFTGDAPKYLLVSQREANEIWHHIGAASVVQLQHLTRMTGTHAPEHRCIALLKLLNGCLNYTRPERTALLTLLSLVPDTMQFIDQSVLDLALSPELWHETWNLMSRASVLSKHNGFVAVCNEIWPPPGSHNASLVQLIVRVNQLRLFSSSPSEFIAALLALRDTVRDYKYSDLDSLFGQL